MAGQNTQTTVGIDDSIASIVVPTCLPAFKSRKVMLEHFCRGCHPFKAWAFDPKVEACIKISHFPVNFGWVKRERER